MSVKFSPAPWYALAEGITDAAIGYRAVIDNDGYTICNPSPMGEANARLIAAAPDLLAAADDALADLEGYEFAAETIQKLRAAIAKATGN